MAAVRRIGRRPRTLADVALRANAGEAFDPLLREFLDTFYLSEEGRREATRAVPEHVRPIPDAYLAAVAEHLCLRYRLPTPAWTEEPHRFLHEPYFAGGFESLKAILLAESPLAFRRRGIFVSKDALSRPRDTAMFDNAVSDVQPISS